MFGSDFCLSSLTAFSDSNYCVDALMAAASLDSTYYVEDWFMKKGRLLVHVARKAHRIKRELDSPWRKAASWFNRQSSQFQ